MTRFTSTLAIATVAFAFVAGFGPGLVQPAFAGKGGHEAAQHEINGGKGGVDHNSADKAGGTSSTDKSGGTSSVDKGGEKNSANGGKGDHNSADKSGGTSSTDKSGGTSSADKGADNSSDKNGGSGDKAEPAEAAETAGSR